MGTNSIELSALAKIPLVESRRVATRYARRVAQVVRVAPCLLVVPTWRTTKKQQCSRIKVQSFVLWICINLRNMSTPVHAVAIPRVVRVALVVNERVAPCCPTSATQHITTFFAPKSMGQIAYRVLSRRDAPSGIWAVVGAQPTVHRPTVTRHIIDNFGDKFYRLLTPPKHRSTKWPGDYDC